MASEPWVPASIPGEAEHGTVGAESEPASFDMAGAEARGKEGRSEP